MAAIDADAHVVETEHTWDYLDPADRQYRPLLKPSEDPTTQNWFIDGQIRGELRRSPTARELMELEKAAGRAMAVSRETASMENVEARIDHMDRLGIDVQVLYPTIFTRQVTDKAEIEVALCKSYNRWLADIWRQGKGRLRWACVLPFMSMPDALDMLPWCKDHGAVAVFMRPIEGTRLVQDPYFYPLYERASQLNISIGVHRGNGNPQVAALLSQHSGWARAGFAGLIVTVGACHQVIASRLMARFPQLRMGFIEAGASWLPFVVTSLRRRPEGRRLPDNFMEEDRIFATCLTTDDIGYITKAVGEGVLMIGTDYGHHDAATELDALRNLSTQEELEPHIVTRILEDNPRTLYAL